MSRAFRARDAEPVDDAAVTIGRGSDFIGVFVGAIDSVCIYNRALSAAEIAAIAADKS